MHITFDPAKRTKNLAERGLDFADAVNVFSGPVFEIEDTRRDYGERRIVNDREIKTFRQQLEED